MDFSSLSSSFPPSRERRGGKGKAEPLKPIFLLILEWMKLKKVIKNRLFHPLFPISPPFPLFPLRQGKKSNLITEPIIQIIISLTFKDKKDTNHSLTTITN